MAEAKARECRFATPAEALARRGTQLCVGGCVFVCVLACLCLLARACLHNAYLTHCAIFFKGNRIWASAQVLGRGARFPQICI